MPSIGGKHENDEKAHRNHIRTITDRSLSYTTRVTAEETAVTYTYENGTLTFRGTGAIEKQTDGEENPWRSYKDTATNLVIEVGITEIGDSAFSGFTKLQKISLPKGCLGTTALKSAAV